HKVVEIAAEAKYSACPFECLSVCRCHSVRVVSPLLASARMRSNAGDHHRTSNQYFAADDGLAFVHASNVVHGFDPVSARPALRGEERVQSVGVSARISIGHDLSALFVIGRIHHPPTDLVRWKWHLKLGEDLFDVKPLLNRGILVVRHVRGVLLQNGISLSETCDSSGISPCCWFPLPFPLPFPLESRNSTLSA